MEYLASDKSIVLFNHGEKTGHSVRIKRFLRHSSSFAVYKASFMRKTGFLFELCNEDYQTRLAHGKLKTISSAKDKFSVLRNDIENRFKLIKSQASDIFPEFEILYDKKSIDPTESGNLPYNIYIFSESKNAKSFSDFLSDDKENRYPEHKLYGVLKIMLSIVEGMNGLNKNCLCFDSLTLDDISVLYDSKFDINKKYPKLFCFDKIISGDSDLVFASDSDLIGRLLYRALTGKEYTYEKKDLIYEKISSSWMFAASVRNSDVYILNCLVKTITSLINADYTDYTQVISDLNRSVNFLLFEDRKSVSARPLDSSKSESRVVSNAVIQNMLFERPLYLNRDNNTEKLNIMTIGCGNYSQTFISAALQFSQMLDTDPWITAVSDNPRDDKEVYLTNKKILSKFVSIDGEECIDAGKTEEPFAHLNFEPINDEGSSFSPADVEHNRRLIEDLCERHSCVSYVFIALGNDTLNKSIADIYAETAEAFDIHCCVNYVCESGNLCSEKAFPVYVNKYKIIPSELKDMALKAHLIWSKEFDKDIDTVRSEFENDRYNFLSSLSNVISIRYKLAGLGIDYSVKDRASLLNAADEYYERVIANKDRSLAQSLTWLEHKRWILEKVCDGWTRLENLNNDKTIAKICDRMSIKDSDSKKHHCLVRSSRNTVNDLWESDVKELDPLDNVSKILYQKFIICAESAKKDWPFYDDILSLTRNRISKFNGKKVDLNNALYAFEKYRLAVRNIVNGENEGYAKRYHAIKSNLIAACIEISGQAGDEINGLLKSIDKAVFPAIEYLKKTDYKKIDSDLILKIPYILTCPVSPPIAMGFNTESTETFYKNVASVMLLGSKQVQYFYWMKSAMELNYFERKVRKLQTFFGKKNYYCRISFFVAVGDQLKNMTDTIKQRLDGISGINFYVGSYSCEKDAHKAFAGHLDNNILFLNKTVKTYDEDYLNNDFAKQLELPCIEYSLERNAFYTDERCDYMKYCPGELHISVDDLLFASDCDYYSFKFPDITLVEKMWNTVRKNSSNVSNWGFLCRQMRKNILSHPLAAVEVNAMKSTEKKEKCFKYLSSCFKSCKKVANYLKDHYGIDCSVTNSTEGFCVVKGEMNEAAKQLWGNLQKKDDVFSNTQILKIEPMSLKKQDEEKDDEHLVIYLDNAAINELDIIYSDSGKRNDGSVRLLKDLAINGLISIEKGELAGIDKSTAVSFAFNNLAVKNLMLKEGDLLEAYIFSQMVKSGYWDDYASGLEFKYNSHTSEIVRNEVDCVLTKGSQTFILEAKMRPAASIDQNVVHKLANITNSIGVNAKKILVITNQYDNSKPALQLSRSDLNEIIVIDGVEQVTQIGQIMQEICEGTYIPKQYV